MVTNRKTYRDFYLKLEEAKAGHYRIEARGSTAGDAEAVCQLPFDDRDLELFLLRIARPRVIHSDEAKQLVRDFGRRLFDAVMTGQVRDVYMRARNEADVNGSGLRIRLRLGSVPNLSDIPWEFMHNGTNFLALSQSTPLIRYLDVPHPPKPLEITPPLRILLTVSSPEELIPIDAAAEREKIERALHSMVASGMVQVSFTPDANLRTLDRTLKQAERRSQPYHMWHYIGHGSFQRGESVLMMESPRGAPQAVSGETLGMLFQDHPDVRLVLLNACEGARTGLRDPFSGVAAALVERRLPAVIGMQFEITDRAAVDLAGSFYETLVANQPVEAALQEARRAIYLSNNPVEWATPVLFMRSESGHLFEISGEPDSLEETPSQALPRTMVIKREDLIAAQHASDYRLIIRSEERGARTVILNENVVTIGRDPGNHVELHEKSLSRHHAQLIRTGQGYAILDRGSTNGTYVNNDRIDALRQLSPGDIIRLAQSVWIHYLAPSDD